MRAAARSCAELVRTLDVCVHMSHPHGCDADNHVQSARPEHMSIQRYKPVQESLGVVYVSGLKNASDVCFVQLALLTAHGHAAIEQGPCECQALLCVKCVDNGF